MQTMTLRCLGRLVLAVALAILTPALLRADEAHPPAGAAAPAAPAAPATPDILAIDVDLAVWSIVIFAILLVVLRTYAWGPMVKSLHVRETHIRGALDEAKNLRIENAKGLAELQKRLDSAYAEIPKLMEQARKDADALKEKIRTEAAAEVQADRTRLLREVDNAKDQALQSIWSQAAQLATLISTKVIGRSLSVEDHRRLVDEATADLKEKAKA
jgi:F-type H+-transporting ATPase subunit b